MEPPPLGSILIRRAYGPRDPAMASGNNDDIQNLNAFLGGWSAAVARMAIPSDATLRGSSQGASAVDFQHAACYRAARRLLGILPPEAIAFPLGIDVSQLTRHGVAPTLTIHLRLAATFAPDTIAVGARALDELQQFARASDVTITPLVAFAYLEKADTDARERARGRRDDAARRGATPTARVTTGSYVRQSLARALAWLQRHYGLEVSPTPALARVGHVVPTPPPPSQPAMALSIRMVIALERLASDRSQSVFLRCHAAAWHAMALSCNRHAQFVQATLVRNSASAQSSRQHGRSTKTLTACACAGARRGWVASKANVADIPTRTTMEDATAHPAILTWRPRIHECQSIPVQLIDEPILMIARSKLN